MSGPGAHAERRWFAMGLEGGSRPIGVMVEPLSVVVTIGPDSTARASIGENPIVPAIPVELGPAELITAVLALRDACNDAIAELTLREQRERAQLGKVGGQ